METSKLESKYERLRKIGIGSYGVVFKCVNRQSGQIVAIKRYSENDSDPIIRKIAMREVRMLRQLKHPNLINLIEVFRRKRRLHLVFDYCELTVLDVIEKYTNNCPLNLIKKIIWQTVNGINYCHSHNCIHRDIKPENILINQAGVVKLCDFGFARNISKWPPPSSGANGERNGKQMRDKRDELTNSKSFADFELAIKENQQVINNDNNASERQALTEYVATRWYRAPELLIGDVHYDIKIDIWAIGCVTAELMRGEPIWPGKTDVDQLSIIKSTLGQLTPTQAHTLLTQSIYDQPTIEKILIQNAIESESIERKLPTNRVGQSGLDFVSACLRMDPRQRPTSDDLLRHVYIHSARMSQFMSANHNHRSNTNTRARNLSDGNAALVGNSSTTGLNDLEQLSNSRSIKLLAANSSTTKSPSKRIASQENQRQMKQLAGLTSSIPVATPAHQQKEQRLAQIESESSQKQKQRAKIKETTSSDRKSLVPVRNREQATIKRETETNRVRVVNQKQQVASNGSERFEQPKRAMMSNRINNNKRLQERSNGNSLKLTTFESSTQKYPYAGHQQANQLAYTWTFDRPKKLEQASKDKEGAKLRTPSGDKLKNGNKQVLLNESSASSTTLSDSQQQQLREPNTNLKSSYSISFLPFVHKSVATDTNK